MATIAQVWHSGSEITVFGETKTVREWARDHRCPVDEEAVLARLDEGADPFTAVTRPFGRDVEAPLGVPTKSFRSRFRVQGRRDRVSLTAWGETKLLTDWADDVRCRVTASALRTRILKGWAPELALTEPLKPHATWFMDTELTAFGLTMAVRDWLKSDLCRVDQATLRARIKAGWDAEKAMKARRKKKQKKVMLTAWGETKCLNQWGKDPRCSVASPQIAYRLKRGWSPEDAVSAPPKFKMRHFSHSRLEAFGEVKTYDEWSQDPRCQVRDTSLRGRIKNGWPLEKALTTPSRGRPPVLRVTAWGETKTFSEWADDPRCTVDRLLAVQRFRDGWTTEDALSVPPFEPGLRRYADPVTFQTLTIGSETKRLRDWARDPRCSVPVEQVKRRLEWGWPPEQAVFAPTGDRSRMIAKCSKRVTAWGETKTVREWASDPRCVVSRSCLTDRLRKDYTPEEAMTAPMGVKRRHNPPPDNSKRVTAWGETKNIAAWAADPRCQVKEGVVYSRLAKGWSPELALTAPKGSRLDGEAGSTEGTFQPSRFLTVFGETQSLEAWSKDPRCAVKPGTFTARVRDGWEPERALTTPTMPYGFRPGKAQPTFQEFTAWGETKTLGEWARDRRCRVSLDLVRNRLARGWTIQRALTERPHRRGPVPKQKKAA